MTRHPAPQRRRKALEPIDDKVDHVRGGPKGHLLIEYGDYECPFSRQAFRQIEQVEQRLNGELRFAFRQFPLTDIHPHALAAAAAAEAAALQGRFWKMHDLLFRHQQALTEDDLRHYADQLKLDSVAFDLDRTTPAVFERIQRDVDSGITSGQVRGTPTLFIDGRVYVGKYDALSLLQALS